MVIGLSWVQFGVGNHMSDNKIDDHEAEYDLRPLIKDQIERNKVLLPVNHKNYNFQETNSQVMKQRENLH